MGRFLFWTAVFLIIGGFLLHFKIHIPYVTTWLGTLPGDFTIKKGKVLIYFPVISAALFSFVVTFISYFIWKKPK